jgi:hypothetical protein
MLWALVDRPPSAAGGPCRQGCPASALLPRPVGRVIVVSFLNRGSPRFLREWRQGPSVSPPAWMRRSALAPSMTVVARGCGYGRGALPARGLRHIPGRALMSDGPLREEPVPGRDGRRAEAEVAADDELALAVDVSGDIDALGVGACARVRRARPRVAVVAEGCRTPSSPASGGRSCSARATRCAGRFNRWAR